MRTRASYVTYIKNHLFAPGCSIEDAGKLSVRSLLSGGLEFSALIVKDTPDVRDSLAHHPSLLIGAWLDMEIPLQPIAELRRRSPSGLASAWRYIRRFGLRYELDSGAEAIEAATKDTIYPYITWRHGEECLFSLDECLAETTATDLIHIYEGSEKLATATFSRDGSAIRLHKLGVRLIDGHCPDLKKSVIGAIYYFLADHQQQAGFETLFIGGGRPFLGDPITTFKLNLGGQPSAMHAFATPKHYQLHLLDDSPGMRETLLDNPVFHLRCSGTVLSFWATPELEASAKFERRIQRYAAIPGIEEVRIHGFDGNDLYTPAHRIVRSDHRKG